VLRLLFVCPCLRHPTQQCPTSFKFLPSSASNSSCQTQRRPLTVWNRPIALPLHRHFHWIRRCAAFPVGFTVVAIPSVGSAIPLAGSPSFMAGFVVAVAFSTRSVITPPEEQATTVCLPTCATSPSATSTSSGYHLHGVHTILYSSRNINTITSSRRCDCGGFQPVDSYLRSLLQSHRVWCLHCD
jgi:hypothetical protein